LYIPSVSDRSRRIIPVVLALATVFSAGWLWSLGADPVAVLRNGPAAASPSNARRIVTFLTLGDTGSILRWRPFSEGQRSVGRGMAIEHQRAPVDALVMLGDNFYPRGLTSADLVFRIRRNLVRPYCAFVDLAAPRSDEVESACPLPANQRRPVPIYAVLGNHDYKTPESPLLERESIPEFIKNWSLPEETAHTVELQGGVSLILVDSPLIARTLDTGEVRRELRKSSGPWRILVAHHPIAIREGREPTGYGGAMYEAILASGRPVQLFLSGHRHNLQLMVVSEPRPMVHVIAGGGSNRRPLREPPFIGRHYAIETTGFARVDLLEAGGIEHLEVSLFTVPRYPIHFWIGPTLVSRWRIDRDGGASQVYPPVPKS